MPHKSSVLIQNHEGLFDWCHLCGHRGDHTADIWYPDNAEHDTKNHRYIRICADCALRIHAAAKTPESVERSKVAARAADAHFEALEDDPSRLDDDP